MSCQEDIPKIFYEKDYGEGNANELILDLNHGLRPGYVITAELQSVHIFAINLRDAELNYIFHLAPRYTSKCLVLNSYFGSWGPEERPTSMPIEKDVKFTFTLSYEPDGYNITINGKEYAFYKHRSLNNPTRFEISSATVFKILYGKQRPDNETKFSEKDYGESGTDGVMFQLDRGLKPGYCVTAVVQGYTTFGINIRDSPLNYLFHFTPRYNDKCVVMNSYFNQWGKEQRSSYMPIENNVRFSFTLTYEVEAYRIYINGEEFAFYKHRSRNDGTAFEITGAKVFKITYGKGIPRWTVNNLIKNFEPEGIEVPYLFYLPVQCHPGAWITVTGIVKNDAKSFSVDIQNSDEDIILHFNPRFVEKYILRNSFLSGKWGNEEKDGGLPLAVGKRFTVGVVVENTCYRLYVNGEEFKTYAHRAVLCEDMTLRVSGDVILYKIMLQQ